MAGVAGVREDAVIEFWYDSGQGCWVVRSIALGGNTPSIQLMHASQVLDWAFQRMNSTQFSAFITPDRHVVIMSASKQWTPIIKDANRNDVYHQLLVYLQMLESQ